MAVHPTRVIRSLLQLLEYVNCAPKDDDKDDDEIKKRQRRYWTRKWKLHIEKHGRNQPMLFKCSICSGEEQKWDIKHGKWKKSRPTKAERDERLD